MKPRYINWAISIALMAGAFATTSTWAQVGEPINKNMSQNVQAIDNGIPPEAEHTFMKYLRTYVPAQSSDGQPVASVPYNDASGALVKERTVAKPLIGAFIYGPVDYPEPVADENVGGFVGHGLRDAYAAVSLDDGNTWKTTNLSGSAELFSQVMPDYPGDVINVVHAVSGRHIAVAWPSRLCSTGSPAYTLDADTEYTRDLNEVAAYLGIDLTADLYLTDLFGVAGSQGSVDYTDQGYPTVGEVPFSCLWTARGVLFAGDDPRTADVVEANHVVWYKPERLTSGVRDVNRVEIAMVANAGVAITWQEDPEGLLPGQGEGPGEGWSGAIANSQTDVWYSFLPDAHFEAVIDAEGNPVALADYWTVDAAKPKPYVPFAVPMRLTNNARCLGGGTGQGERLYCTEAAAAYQLKNQCADTATIPTGQSGQPTPICVSEDGLPNVANTAATRPRLSLQPRLDSLGNTVGAWVVVVAEESKGMGRYFFTERGEGLDGNPFFFRVGEVDAVNATPCEEGEPDCEVADDGKNIWYFSFEMGSPQTSADLSETGLVKNLVSQGNLLNQPESDWRTGTFYSPLDTADMWNFISDTTGASYNFFIHRTEIARRGSLLVQPLGNMSPGSKLMAMPMYKQGLMQQGGPADVMARRIINAGTSANPYDFTNLVCEETLYTDGSNPYYPKGICMSPAVNVSGTTPQACELGGGGTNDTSDGICPTINTDAVASTDPMDQNTFDKLAMWVQCPGSPECGTFPESTALGSNLDDQSWYNPLDVGKGHRGYLWRDMVVVMYAWSPNWKRNTVGNDRYELYIRRSFDGGRTWTTTPATWGGQGTTTCERMRDGETAPDATQVCTAYTAGAPEQSRNVSQLQSSDGTGTYKYTVLDPRYAPDPPTMPTINSAFYDRDSDEFNPSRFFVVYETGDNETTVDGEAEALDLFYGRAIGFGDHYQVTAPEAGIQSACLPGLTTAGVFCNEFERLTTGSDVSAEEASLAMSPAGDTLYSAWAQFSSAVLPPDEPLSDADFARIWYTDVYADWTAVDAPTIDEPVIGDGTPYVPERLFANGFE
jgi:hypothetical protein